MDADRHAIKALIIEHEVTDTIDSANNQAAFSTDLALINHFDQVEHESQRVVDDVVLCNDCDNPIPAARLAAIPACFRCIDCQTAHEKELKLCH